MRRTLLIPIASTAVLIAILLPATALGSSDRIDRSTQTSAQVAADGLAVTDAARIRLGCAVKRYHAAPVVVCRWSGVESQKLRGYKLWRTVGAPGTHERRLIAKIPADARLRHVDARVRRGHVYTYVVVAVAKDGSKLAVGGPVVVRVPGRHHALRFVCAVGVHGDDLGVGCKWSESKRPAAVGYVLWRSVDGGAREAIYRAGLDGPRHFFDTEVERGQTIRYAVIAVDKAGHRVGKGGPVVVRIPARR
jgi:hypothetical protein